MLTKRQNLVEVMKGGNPDRFVKQYEAFAMMMKTPITRIKPPVGGEIVNEWGVTIRWPEGQLGAFPVHDEEHIVIKDITKWQDYVKAPSVEQPAEKWAVAIAEAEAVDRKDQYVTVFVAPGIFEQVHYLLSMEEALMAFYEEPEAMHELIDYIVDFELKLAKEFIDHLHPDALFHHDDWGSQINSFISPAMFKEFFEPAYKKIYGYYKDNGVELVIHHSDSYAANLVPSMIEMGIDIWQGVMTTNHVPELIKQYGGKITFMGDIDSGVIDFPGWTQENIAEKVETACRRCGKLYFIPGASQGLNVSSFPGVYEATDEEIDKMTKEMF
ncbi:uroporphyrinogen decarboxylase family protein [Acetobacterium sp.]|jgi:uroporphyrinogen-III decarboxylase|uniref:uroporphyrinogen decarboxylase family protein n=1 Tax=Acetobacterium sp. TaxID=1872094 RepID=UPI00271EFB34|nr:uroporphyrinogen decarboxylase family protein [Acetobacterium sp.]MDO9493225.1 uroporphyrinogen decarboxylase family protein [Acetobacterium sp.]